MRRIARASTLRIRPATAADAAPISALIMRVSHTFTLQPDGAGAEEFFATVTPEAIGGYLASPEYAYLVAEEDGALAGFAAVRGNTHLYHLFVDPAFQGRGLSRRLWDEAMGAALRAGNPGEFTVNSSMFAVPVYQRFGFVPAGPRTEMQGLAFMPMKLVLATDGH
ncbi:MAG TPA: GNAT family N-acetyltransferase [Longimicrobium sp.]|nr:GNAT family N-acetyltransferase [Longimicrobium sp.]